MDHRQEKQGTQQRGVGQDAQCVARKTAARAV
jgi:hypothetical protein